MLRIGEARHPGPRCPLPDRLSIECVDVGCWLSNGDLAVQSVASFLSVVEHRLIPAIPGGHAGVGVVSIQGAPSTLPSFCTADFEEYFGLGRAIRVTLPLANGSIVHLFVVFGYQGG